MSSFNPSAPYHATLPCVYTVANPSLLPDYEHCDLCTTSFSAADDHQISDGENIAVPTIYSTSCNRLLCSWGLNSWFNYIGCDGICPGCDSQIRVELPPPPPQVALPLPPSATSLEVLGRLTEIREAQAEIVQRMRGLAHEDARWAEESELLEQHVEWAFAELPLFQEVVQQELEEDEEWEEGEEEEEEEWEEDEWEEEEWEEDEEYEDEDGEEVEWVLELWGDWEPELLRELDLERWVDWELSWGEDEDEEDVQRAVD